jgi:hypothetical protein
MRRMLGGKGAVRQARPINLDPIWSDLGHAAIVFDSLTIPGRDVGHGRPAVDGSSAPIALSHRLREIEHVIVMGVTDKYRLRFG